MTGFLQNEKSLPFDYCEEGRAGDERHSREEYGYLQPRHQPMLRMARLNVGLARGRNKSEG